MNPIVVAIGEQDHAASVLQWAAEYGHLAGQPLQVLSVFSSTSAEVPPDRFQAMTTEHRDEIVKLLADVDAPRASIEIAMGDVVDEIVNFVNGSDVELVIVGTHGGHRRLGGGFVNFAHVLVHEIDAPVLLVTPTYRPLAGGTIVVGVDGSAANRPALVRAAQIARLANAEIHAVFAYNPRDDTFERPEGWHRHSDEVRAMVDEITDLPIRLVMTAGHPTQVLLEHAETESVALIVVGTRGRGGFASLRVGRVPAQLLSHTTTPLLVVNH